MSQHTKGSWEIIWPENKGVSPRIKCDSFGTICRTNDIWSTENGYEENKANTLLLAAAPDLLEALILALKALDRWHESKAASLYGNDSDKARLACIKAIAKARGE